MKLITLREGVLDFEKDVDSIYNAFFHPIVEKLQRGEMSETEFAWAINQEVSMSSSEMVDRRILQSTILVQAARAIPVEFKFHTSGLPATGRYDTKNKIIYFTFAQDYVMDLLGIINFDLTSSDSWSQRVKDEVTRFVQGESTKETIRHELTHWVDDVRSNGALSNQIARAKVPRGEEPTKDNIKAFNKLTGGHQNKNLGPAEINAIVNGIAEIRTKTLSSVWDDLTFDQLIDNSQALYAVASFIQSEQPDEYQKWRNLVIKRMARENLLGKKMRSELPT